MQRVSEVLVLVHEEGGEAGAYRVSNPRVLPRHPIRDERHVFEVYKASAPQLGFVGLDKRGQVGVLPTPFWSGAVNVPTPLFGGKLPPAVRILRTVDRRPIAGLDGCILLGLGRDSEVRGNVGANAARIGA